MKIRTIKSWLILVLLTIYMFIYKFLILQNSIRYSEHISISFLAILLALSIIFFGFRKDRVNVTGKNIFRIVAFYIVLTLAVIYGIGFVSGFVKTIYPKNFTGVVDNIFIPIFMIVIVEFIRYVFISANKDKRLVIILLTILLTVFELLMAINFFKLGNASMMFSMITTIILPCIFKNILLSYLTYNVGYRIPLIYRLIFDTYLFIIPIVPSLSDYIKSMIFISLPILIYISIFGIVENEDTKKEKVVKSNKFSIFDGIIAVLIFALVSSVSGIFPHYLIGIGSDSMKPAINKGDAVMLEKVNDRTKLKKGDIIAYSSGKIIIVHRIIEVVGDGTSRMYTVKGDANKDADPQFVNRSQIKGIYRFKIPYMAWPTVWLTELFNS